ncbi:CoA ester lyase [Halobacteriales archaeon QH_10_67_13]|nr:MAG: CoA ester lyase [Halobacteriales archaeon QH_10_67_13]
MVRRSVLFSPGDQPDLLRKAPETGADVLVFDLEDGVGPDKSRARAVVAEALAEIDPDVELCVRVNPPGSGLEADAAALSGAPTPDSVMIPKVDGPAEIEAVVEVFEADLPVLALLETAAGVLHAEAIARAEPVEGLLLGAEDLAADTGARRSETGEGIAHARGQVVLAAAAAEINAIDTLYTDFEDREGLAADTERAATFGFDGKMAIHPAQVPVINEAFTPDPEDIEWARRVLEAADREAGVFAVDGEMIDAPLLAQAERTLDRAAAAGGDDAEGSPEA